MERKDRCKCGNRVPKGELKETGVCRACTREKKEKIDAEQEETERADRIAFYRDTLAFWR